MSNETAKIDVPLKDAKLIQKMIEESVDFDGAKLQPMVYLPDMDSSSELKTAVVFDGGKWQLVYCVKPEHRSIQTDAVRLKEKYASVGDDLVAFLDGIAGGQS